MLISVTRRTPACALRLSVNGSATSVSSCSVVLSCCRSITVARSDVSRSIGFIGLGKMGYPMALNILQNCQLQLNECIGEKKRVEVYLLDVAPGRAQQLIKEFASQSDKSNTNEVIAIEAESIGHLSLSCSTIITMLPNTSHVIETMTGSKGVLEHARKGCLLLNVIIILDILSFRSSSIF